MIYQRVDLSAPIRQGDILADIPFINLTVNANGIPVMDDDEQVRAKTWEDILAEGKTEIAAVLPIRKITGIVVTQDCDVPRVRNADVEVAVEQQIISIAEIKPLQKVISFKDSEINNVKNFVKVLPRQARSSLGWFYLPTDGHLPEGNIGFTQKMAADFRVLFPLILEDEALVKTRRIGRLNIEAYEHFRETLGQYFRRYPYDEWYPLNKSEFEEYIQLKTKENSDPRSWQINS